MEAKKMFGIGCLSMIVITIAGLVWLLADDNETSYSGNRDREQQIEQAIANRDYDQAREIAVRMVGDKEQKASLQKVNSAHLNYVIASGGSLEDAEMLAKELSATTEFWDVIAKNILKLYAQDFRMLYSYLVRYPVHYSYKEKISDSYDYGSYMGKSNDGYNSEVKTYNDAIMQVIDLAIFDNKKDYIKKCLPLFKPEAVEISRKQSSKGESYYNLTYKLENKAKAEAMRKIKETGINL